MKSKNGADTGLLAQSVGGEPVENRMTFYRDALPGSIAVYAVARAFSSEKEPVFLEMTNEITSVD